MFPVAKVMPKVNKENIKSSQVYGSMEGKKKLEKVSGVKEDKINKEQVKNERKAKQQQQLEAFFKCKDECTFDKKVCAAIKFRECPCCHNVLKFTCSKAASCQDETGSKPIMIKPKHNIGPKKSLQFESASDSDEDNYKNDTDEDMSDADENDMSADDNLSSADKVIDDNIKSKNGEQDPRDV